MSLNAMATTKTHEKLSEAAAHGTRATLWGIVASSVLAAVKIIGGILGNSYALIADGIESMLDIMSSLVVLGSLRFSTQPADEQHPYGYGKVEPLAALVVATALFAAAVAITIQSIREINTPHHTPAAFTLIILVGVVLTKEWMFRLLVRTGETIGSTSMQTDAWHHRSDSLTSIAAFIGISIALIAGKGYEAADDWAALFAAAVIAFNGSRLFRSAWREVLDASPQPEVIANVRSVAQAVGGVVEIEKCRIRKSGIGMFVDIHVVVDGDMTVREGHFLSHQVKDRIIEEIPGIQDVLAHVEPAAQSRYPSTSCVTLRQ